MTQGHAPVHRHSTPWHMWLLASVMSIGCKLVLIAYTRYINSLGAAAPGMRGNDKFTEVENERWHCRAQLLLLAVRTSTYTDPVMHLWFCYRATAKHTHGLAVDICLSVHPSSVCLSVKHVHCDKTKAPSEKSSIMTNRKSSTCFPIRLRWTAYVAPNPQSGPQRRQFFRFPY